MMEKSNLTVEDILNTGKNRDLQKEFLQGNFLQGYVLKTKKDESFYPVSVGMKQDLIINRLEKIVNILEMKNYSSTLDENPFEPNYITNQNEMKKIINVLESELEKRSNARFAQALSAVGIFTSIVFYFVVGLIGAIKVSGYHFIILIIFFSLTFILSYLTKHYSDR